MLAEIFMVRLEAAARVAQETISASNSRFAPFYQAGSPERIKGEVISFADHVGVYSLSNRG